MKKFIDKEKNRIITVLNVDEAKKILEMYINYCLGKRDATKGRLNLVKYLGDFIQYSEKKDITRFYDILVKDKETFEFSKSDLKAYESLLAFFELYNNIENGEFELNAVTNYINSAVTKKQTIDSKVENKEELTFEEKLNNIFFNKDFHLSILAKNACEKWEEMLKQRIEQSENGIDVTLKEEIAYQDLLALCDSDNLITTSISNQDKAFDQDKNSQQDSKQETVISNSENQGEAKKQEIISNDPEPDIQIDVDEKKEDNNQTNEKKDEEVIGPIIVNNVEENNEHDGQEGKKEDDEEIIGASTIREATQDVSLRDAAGLFNDAIDNLSKKNNNSSENSDSSYKTLRDQ